ncbi:MAG: hypothetical protein A3C88_00495 [Candidatus Yanofskybacteria bacterium RIFCSPHIGHO2_02_FULL_50_12]|uniref:Uncharacterized protein n=1 Tax=Candidatus Yanofskybacteria bacterium RIFCSPHIGHO2_02_FULL_50_12 TaxID=1802685 RepID=A0A1F8FVA6_9BACT|nr:MAG: hypothetical protein A3C88_00495 [Candidatus Yanofskybacteria bacterium RIFCSPHIGHO2_02_FULL_50_12]
MVMKIRYKNFFFWLMVGYIAANLLYNGFVRDGVELNQSSAGSENEVYDQDPGGGWGGIADTLMPSVWIYMTQEYGF